MSELMVEKQQGVPEGYKLTEVGVIPEGWSVESFETLVTPVSTRVNPKTQGAGDFCIELEHIAQNKGILIGDTKTTNKSSLKCVFNEGDVLFGKLRAYLRKYWLADRSGVCSTEIWALRAITNKIISGYVYQIVQTDKFIELASEAYGTHMPRSDWNIIKNLLVATPPIEEQTAIATALSDVDELLTSLEALIAKKQAIKTATMQQLLTGRTRLPQFALREDGSLKGYKQSELGEIPEDWEVYEFGQLLAEFRNGYAFSAQGYVKEGVPIVTMSQIGLSGRFQFDLSRINYWRKSDFNKLKDFWVVDGDLLIAMTDVTPDKNLIGQMVIAKMTEIALLNQRVGLLRLDLKQASPVFYSYLSCLPVWRKYCRGVASLGVQANIGTTDIKKAFTYVPPVEEQIAIATILSDMDAEIEALEQQLNKTQQIKQGMMQQLLTGKIRLVTPK